MLKPVLGSQIQSGYPLAKGLVGCWLLSENGGNKVFDLSGNGNDGTFGAGAASPSWGSGKYGSEISYDGGDYIDVGVNGYSVKELTVVALIKPAGGYSGGSDEFIFECGSGGGDRLVFYFNDDGKLRFLRSSTIGATDYAYSSQTNFSEQYYHVVGIHKADSIDLWIDGISQVSDSGGELDSYSAARIGDLYGGGENHFVGNIAYIYVYNRALSASEIQQLYREPFCMFEQPSLPLIVAATSGAAPIGNAGIMTPWGGYWGATY